MSASRSSEAAWALVFAVAVALAALAARMMARARGGRAGAWTAPGSVAPVALDVAPVEACDVVAHSPASSCSAGDPALALLAWLAALGWVTFNGAPPQRWPWWDAHRAEVWRAVLSCAVRPGFAAADD